MYSARTGASIQSRRRSNLLVNCATEVNSSGVFFFYVCVFFYVCLSRSPSASVVIALPSGSTNQNILRARCNGVCKAMRSSYGEFLSIGKAL